MSLIPLPAAGRNGRNFVNLETEASLSDNTIKKLLMKNVLHLPHYQIWAFLLAIGGAVLGSFYSCNQESIPTPMDNTPPDSPSNPVDSLAGIEGAYVCTCYIDSLGYGDALLNRDTQQQDMVVERFNQSQDTLFMNNTLMVNTLREPHLVFSVPNSSFRYKHSGTFYREQDSLKVYFYLYSTKTFYCYGVK